MRRSKDVRRPIPRPRGLDGDAARAEVRRRCENVFFADEAYGWPERFWSLLESVELRRAYAEAFPEEFAHTFGLEDNGKREPNSWMVRMQCYVFSRPNFVEFLEAHPAKVPFDVPDLSLVKYIDREVTLAHSRAAWWQANGWPMTEEEQVWIRFGGPHKADVLAFPPVSGSVQ